MLNQCSSKSDRIRVLILAEQANPSWVSVPFVGWCHATALGKLAHIHLVTHARNKEAILKSDFPKDQVTFIDLGFFDRLLKWLYTNMTRIPGGGQVTYTAFKIPFYYLFEFYAWRLFRKQLKSGVFDIVHRITPVSPAMPSLFVKRCHAVRVPFIIGPLNGGLPWPKGFAHILKKEREWLSYLRKLHTLLPYAKSTRKCASAIILGSRATWNEMPKKFLSKCFYYSENGITDDLLSLSTLSKPEFKTSPLRIAFAGRLVPLKGVDLIVRAASQLILEKKIHLDIIGDGSERRYLEELVQTGHLSDGVTFHGWLLRDQVFSILSKSHVFAFPSIREFGGGAVIEAMALGLVPIVVDYGGPAEIVTPETGFILPLTTTLVSLFHLPNCLKNLMLELKHNSH